MRNLLFFITLFSLVHLTGNATTIKCENPDYAGKKLNFFKYSDPISLENEFVFSLEFDANGKCSKFIDNNATIFTFCDFGIYRGMLFLEPNQTINIKLPPLREKSFADKKNPYFSPVSFWFATENKQQTNNQILDFTQQFNQLTNQFFNQLYFRQSKEIYDSVIFLLDKKFSTIKSVPFTNHKNFKLKMVEVDVFREKPEKYSEFFSSAKQEFWLTPSFIALFEKTFANQLSFTAKEIKSEKIGIAVNSGDIYFLLNYVKTKYKIGGKIAELALLEMLYDGYYSNDFSKKSIKKMVKNELFTKNSNQIIKEAAHRISEKFTFLQKGTLAPIICLNNFNNQQVCTNSTNDKFKYIVFADAEMIVCREHLKYLDNIQHRFHKHLEIIVVFRKTNLIEIKKYLDENNIPGTKLIDENNTYINKYKVKSFPQCFLLDENHKVKFATAKAPLDGFEQQFGSFIQRELFERQRNQSR